MAGNSLLVFAAVGDLSLIEPPVSCDGGSLRRQVSFGRRGGDARDHQFPRTVESGCHAALHDCLGP